MFDILHWKIWVVTFIVRITCLSTRETEWIGARHNGQGGGVEMLQTSQYWSRQMTHTKWPHGVLITLLPRLFRQIGQISWSYDFVRLALYNSIKLNKSLRNFQFCPKNKITQYYWSCSNVNSFNLIQLETILITRQFFNSRFAYLKVKTKFAQSWQSQLKNIIEKFCIKK